MMGMLLSCGQTDVLALLADVLGAWHAWFPSFLTIHQCMGGCLFVSGADAHQAGQQLCFVD